MQVKANKNGPYIITGSATYTDVDGNEQTTQGSAIALCRCGQSSNKPFCDGTHRTAGFKGTEIVLQVDSD